MTEKHAIAASEMQPYLETITKGLYGLQERLPEFERNCPSSEELKTVAECETIIGNMRKAIASLIVLPYRLGIEEDLQNHVVSPETQRQ